MVHTLMILGDDGAVVICPFCHGIYSENDIDINDYVKHNILLWCRKCREILLCYSPSNDGCACLISKREAQSYFINPQKIEEYDPRSKYEYYKVGIIEVLGVKTQKNDEYTEVKAMKFLDIPKNIDTSHDGWYLWYKGICTECNRHYESKIWGD